MYENLFKSMMSHAIGPLPPVTNCHTSDPSPSSVTYFMDGPCPDIGTSGFGFLCVYLQVCYIIWMQIP